jgi:spore coat polysaccharide biosynthesis protein SpsF (cytidylyltransferase family)
MSIIEHLIARMAKHFSRESIFICTSRLSDDDILEEIAIKNRVSFVRSDPLNILTRFQDVINKSGAEYVVRVTGDNPCTSPELIKTIFEKDVSDIVGYAKIANAPLGVGSEVYSQECIAELSRSLTPSQLEKTEYLSFFLPMQKNIKQCIVPAPKAISRPYYSLTIDTPTDLVFMNKILSLASCEIPSIEEIVTILDQMNDYKGLSPDALIKTPFGRRERFEDVLKLINGITDDA